VTRRNRRIPCPAGSTETSTSSGRAMAEASRDTSDRIADVFSM